MVSRKVKLEESFEIDRFAVAILTKAGKMNLSPFFALVDVKVKQLTHRSSPSLRIFAVLPP